MAFFFYPSTSSTPQTALSTLKRRIDNEQATTWSYRGNDFFYKPEQWRGTVKFQAELYDTHIGFTAKEGSGNPSKSFNDAYVYVHGRFLELLMGHAGPFSDIKARDNRVKN